MKGIGLGKYRDLTAILQRMQVKQELLTGRITTELA